MVLESQRDFHDVLVWRVRIGIEEMMVVLDIL